VTPGLPSPRTEAGKAGLAALLRTPSRALIALDFDGTLSPIVDDPAAARAHPGAVGALRRLSRLAGTVAVITGRAAPAAVELGGLDQVPGLLVLGQYGRQRWESGTLTSPPVPPGVAAARQQLPGVLSAAGAPGGIWTEDKGDALAVHTRRAADPQQALDQLRGPLADLAERYGNGELRTTIMQNIIVVNVPNAKTAELVVALNSMELQVDVSAFWRGAIACTGTEFCKLAISETKGFSKWLVSEMEERLPGFDQQIKLHVTGCTNSCGQHWIADIGLEGKKIKKDGQLVDAFYFCVGGAVGRFARTARPLGFRAAADEVPDAIERLLRGYLDAREPGEDLRAYFARTDDDSLRAQLAGTVVEPVERDAPPVGAGRHAPGE